MRHRTSHPETLNPETLEFRNPGTEPLPETFYALNPKLNPKVNPKPQTLNSTPKPYTLNPKP